MEPRVKPLPRERRKSFFRFLFLIFFLSLPVFMFYAAGYRYDFFAEVPAITATGGMYVSVDTVDATIYLNEVEVNDMRVFRNASYLQGLEPGVHRVHVQASGTATWVKELPVYPHLVTEVEAFNMPLRPQVRPITEYLTSTGVPVVFGTSTATVREYTVAVVATTSKATTTLERNSEWLFINDSFLEKASTTKWRLEKEARLVASTTATTSITDAEQLARATTTIVRDDLRLFKQGEDVYVEALGRGRDVPNYFCASAPTPGALGLDATLHNAKTTSESYSSFPLREAPTLSGECRTLIKMDRKDQVVRDFVFLPDDSNLILMHLGDGIYVVEVDDRAWQNSQLLYPGKGLEMLVEGRSIYVKDGSRYFEVFTTIATQ